MVRDKWGKIIEEDLKCMDCGKPIDHKREAPSGSMIPRCEKCNSKRWRQHQKDIDNPRSAVTGQQYNWDDPWG